MLAARRSVGPVAGRHQRVRYTAPALDKGLDILELFASQAEGMSPSQVARRLGRSVGEIFRMLICLQQRGYLSRSGPDERYKLTLKLFEVAHRHPPLERLLTGARPLMEQVAQFTGQSCHLAMLSGSEVVVVARAESPGSMSFSLRLGAAIDLLQTGSGQVILAFQPPELRARSLEAWRERYRGQVPRNLECHLGRIRRRGYEQVASYQIRGVINISFPVFNQHGEAVAAMSVPFLGRTGNSVGPRQVREALRAATCHLSAAIGGARTKLLLRGD